MDRKPGRTEEQEQQRSGSAHGEESGLPDTDTDAPPETERLGPLTLRRMRKDDGRALVVYSREQPSP